MNNLFLSIFLCFSCFKLSAQSMPDSTERRFHLGIQAMTLVVHTFKTGNPQRYDLKLDKNGYGVLIPGIVLNADWYFWKKKPKIHLRFAGSWYKDSGFNNAGYVHAGLRRDFFKKANKKVYWTAGIGPAFFIRDNWNAIYPGRVQDPFYGDRETKNGLYQYRFFPIGGEIDFMLSLKNDWELDFSIVPGAPAAIIFKFGCRKKL